MEAILTGVFSLSILVFVAIKLRNIFSFVADSLSKITYFIISMYGISLTLTQSDVTAFGFLCTVLFFVIAYQGLVFLSSVFQQTFAAWLLKFRQKNTSGQLEHRANVLATTTTEVKFSMLCDFRKIEYIVKRLFGKNTQVFVHGSQLK